MAERRHPRRLNQVVDVSGRKAVVTRDGAKYRGEARNEGLPSALVSGLRGTHERAELGCPLLVCLDAVLSATAARRCRARSC